MRLLLLEVLLLQARVVFCDVGHPRKVQAFLKLHKQQWRDSRENARNGRAVGVQACANSSVPLPIPSIPNACALGSVAEDEGFHVGAELGVKEGIFARRTLNQWPSCKQYVLVDIWAPQNNYADIANKGVEVQQRVYQQAMEQVQTYRGKVSVCRNFTTSCANQFPDDYFDYIYVDARHDRKSVLIDLHDWWPKLRSGGIMAGDDYMFAPGKLTGQEWDLNFDGTRDMQKLAVRGAVDDFAREVCRQVMTLKGTDDQFGDKHEDCDRQSDSWAIRK